MSSSSSATSEIQKYLTDNKAVCFSASWCPYCKKLKSLLSKYPITSLKIVELDELKSPSPSEDDFRAALKQLTGATSVPRFFLAGKFIGGCDDVTALDNAGKFEPMLVAAGALVKKGSL